MPCYSPLMGYMQYVSPGYKWKFCSVRQGMYEGGQSVPERMFGSDTVQVPCGRCIGCRLERAREWAARCMHEARCHDTNYFITLTYAPEHLPLGGTLVKRDWQLFVKRLRKRVGKFRYYHCGEYGDKLGRPHYHAILFGIDLCDLKLFKSGSMPLYTSQLLTDVWGKGHVTVGAATFESAAYCARYCTKKITGKAAEDHYRREVDGIEFSVLPEYNTMSRNPGIGFDWYERNKDAWFRDDFMIVNGRETNIPRYYNNLYANSNPEEFRELHEARRIRNFERESLSYQDLKNKEINLRARMKRLSRELEEAHAV